MVLMRNKKNYLQISFLSRTLKLRLVLVFTIRYATMSLQLQIKTIIRETVSGALP